MACSHLRKCFSYSFVHLYVYQQTKAAFTRDRLEPVRNWYEYQVIPGNDQNTSSTNQKTAGSNLERTS